MMVSMALSMGEHIQFHFRNSTKNSKTAFNKLNQFLPKMFPVQFVCTAMETESMNES